MGAGGVVPRRGRAWTPREMIADTAAYTIFFLNRVMTVFYFLLFKFFTYLVFAFKKSMITFVSVQSILHEYTSALHSDFTRVL